MNPERPRGGQRSGGGDSSRRRPAAAGGPARRHGEITVPAEALKVWVERGLTQFKVAEVGLTETRDNARLEQEARARARGVQGQIVYNYLLNRKGSTAWWQEWGGFDLESEILTEAVLSIPSVKARIAAFDPKDNEWGLDTVEDYRDVLLQAHHGDVEEDDLRRGLRRWLGHLSPDARRLFARDIKSWLKEPAPKPEG
ncbi:MAG: hypothetical protein DHS20C03_24660 [Minwuia thermotolerans]|nr:MAG: hypothetical protein DHS20C03_24660 [Minwuia thermotolerans]